MSRRRPLWPKPTGRVKWRKLDPPRKLGKFLAYESDCYQIYRQLLGLDAKKPRAIWHLRVSCPGRSIRPSRCVSTPSITYAKGCADAAEQRWLESQE